MARDRATFAEALEARRGQSQVFTLILRRLATSQSLTGNRESVSILGSDTFCFLRMSNCCGRCPRGKLLLRKIVGTRVDRRPLLTSGDLFGHLPQGVEEFWVRRIELPDPARDRLKFVPMNNKRDKVTIDVALQVAGRFVSVSAYCAFVTAAQRVYFL